MYQQASIRVKGLTLCGVLAEVPFRNGGSTLQLKELKLTTPLSSLTNNLPGRTESSGRLCVVDLGARGSFKCGSKFYAALRE